MVSSTSKLFSSIFYVTTREFSVRLVLQEFSLSSMLYEERGNAYEDL